MIKANQIPKEVWKAAWDGYVNSGCTMAEAVAAAINAWPGMLTERRARCDAVVLPFNLDPDIGT